MAEITRKRVGEVLRKLFEILMRTPEGVPAGDALKQLATSITLTDYEAGFYESSGTRRFEKIVRFATVDCVKAGWLLKQKGTWTVTETGVEAFKKFPDPEAFYKEAVRLYRKWKASREGPATERDVDAPEEIDGSEKSASITLEEANEQSWQEIERFLRTMDPYEFQELVAGLLKAMGYHISWVSPRGKDGGIDVVAYTDPLGTRPPRIKVQVKRTGQSVNSDGLKSFLALINDDDVGLFVSVSGFTRDAKDFARNQERRKITLIDLERLVDLWKEFYDKLEESARQRLALTRVYFLTPPE